MGSPAFLGGGGGRRRREGGGSGTHMAINDGTRERFYPRVAGPQQLQ